MAVAAAAIAVCFITFLMAGQVARLLGVTGRVALTRIGLVPGGAIRHRRDWRNREVRKFGALTRPRVSRPARAYGAHLEGLEAFPWFASRIARMADAVDGIHSGSVRCARDLHLAAFSLTMDSENPSLG